MSELDNLFAGVEGSAEAKERVKIIIETVTGFRTDEDACSFLNVSQTEFDAMRDSVMQRMLDAAE